MGRQVFSYEEYKVFKSGKGYIVYNTRKPFKYGHTHVKDFNTTKFLIHHSKHRIIPAHLSKYLWVSLYRISTGKEYCRKLRCIIDNNIITSIKEEF